MMDDERLRCCTANLFVKFCPSAEELRSTALGAIRSPLRDITLTTVIIQIAPLIRTIT